MTDNLVVAYQLEADLKPRFIRFVLCNLGSLDSCYMLSFNLCSTKQCSYYMYVLSYKLCRKTQTNKCPVYVAFDIF